MTESPQDVPPQPEGQSPPQGGYPPQPPPQQPLVPYPGYAVQSPLSPGDARMWAIFAHLGGTFLSFLVPLVIFLVYKDRDPFVRRHSSQALNFHITLFIAYLVSAILIFVLIGLVLLPLLFVASIVLTIMAAVAANDGRDWVYPGAIQFVH
ncbi:MAG TPA: DUF4870 domain-containing protein [Oryzihumus sp.]|nr:DUF4870 domain-containing protein [Oryzihumus sp.]